MLPGMMWVFRELKSLHTLSIAGLDLPGFPEELLQLTGLQRLSLWEQPRIKSIPEVGAEGTQGAHVLRHALRWPLLCPQSAAAGPPLQVPRCRSPAAGPPLQVPF